MRSRPPRAVGEGGATPPDATGRRTRASSPRAGAAVPCASTRTSRPKTARPGTGRRLSRSRAGIVRARPRPPHPPVPSRAGFPETRRAPRFRFRRGRGGRPPPTTVVLPSSTDSPSSTRSGPPPRPRKPGRTLVRLVFRIRRSVEGRFPETREPRVFDSVAGREADPLRRDPSLLPSSTGLAFVDPARARPLAPRKRIVDPAGIERSDGAAKGAFAAFGVAKFVSPSSPSPTDGQAVSIDYVIHDGGRGTGARSTAPRTPGRRTAGRLGMAQPSRAWRRP